MSDLKVSLVLQLKNLLGRGLRDARSEMRGLKSEAQGLSGVRGPAIAGLVAYRGEARRSVLAVRELRRETALLGRGGGSALLAGGGAVGRFVGGIGGGALAGGLTLAGAGAFAGAASREAAAVERSMTRIAITGDASRTQQQQAALEIERIAARTGKSSTEIREALDSLVAAGRSLPEAMAFLPSVVDASQASGSQTIDIAKTADAVSGSLEIAATRMGRAFDIMVTAGKLGKFELKDMAQFLPEIAPMAKAAGARGTEGLASVVAALQMIRKETGSASTAATNLQNVYSKMFSAETEKKFEKMGVDLPKALEEAKNEGKDLLDVFVALTNKTIDGDLTKLPKLFEDMQAQAGMRALINNLKAWRDMTAEIGRTADGAVGRDMKRVLEDTQTGFDRAAAAASRFGRNIGDAINASGAASSILGGIAAGLDKVNDAMERSGDIQRRLDEAGIKPLPQLKTQTEIDADKALAAVEVQKRADASAAEFRDGGFRLQAPGSRGSGRQSASDRAREASEIANGTGATGSAIRDAREQNARQRMRGATPAVLDKINVRLEAQLEGVLAFLARGGLSPRVEKNKIDEAKLLIGQILNNGKRAAGGGAPATDDEIGAALQERLKTLREEAGTTADAVKDKLTLDLTSQGANAGLSWAAGLRSAAPAVAAAVAELRAPILTPAAPIGGAGRPATGGGARTPSVAPSVQVGRITINGASDPERTARLVERRLASAVRSGLTGAHHDGVV